MFWRHGKKDKFLYFYDIHNVIIVKKETCKQINIKCNYS